MRFTKQTSSKLLVDLIWILSETQEDVNQTLSQQTVME